MKIHDVIKEELLKRDISQRQLALRLNMDPSTLNKKLNGDRAIYLDEFAQILTCLKLSADDILSKTHA